MPEGNASGELRVNVLVVEDVPQLRQITSRMLAGLGLQVTAVDGPAEALARFRSGERFDLVLSDIVMPGDISGIMLVRELRKVDPRLKIILASGYSDPDQFQDGLDELEFAFLSKPFRQAELAEAVHRLLDGEEGAES